MRHPHKRPSCIVSASSELPMSKKTVTFGVNESLSAEPSSYMKRGLNPEPQISKPAKRKQTLLALISELSALRDEQEIEEEVKDSAPIPADDTQDDNTREGVALFRAFDQQAQNLDRQLQRLPSAVRRLACSVGLANATDHLRGALIQIEFLFRKNAADLFTEIRRGDAETLRTSISSPYKPLGQGQAVQTKWAPQRQGTRERDRIHTRMRPQVKLMSNPEAFPDEMYKLARQIRVFLDRLSDIPGYTDEVVNAPFSSFASDLEYRASCLAELKGQLKTVAVQRYINDLSADVGAHMEDMRDALSVFIDDGVPTIRHTQNHTANGLQYLSTVATFFSGVTATTLQYRLFPSFVVTFSDAHLSTIRSINQTGSLLEDLVNTLWIISLILSVASAVNSQLAYYWHTAMYRSPRQYVPWWVAIWMKRSPLFFLVGSVIAFWIGLCLFTYSSRQSRVVSALVTVFISITASSLVFVGLWFLSERWTFSRTQGQLWLFDILKDTQDRMNKVLGITWVIEHWPKDTWLHWPKDTWFCLSRWIRSQTQHIKLPLVDFCATCICRARQYDDEEREYKSDPVPGEYILPNQRPKSQRLKNLVERIIAMNRSASGKYAASARARTQSALYGPRRSSTDDYAATAFARLQNLKPGLANLQITQRLDQHMMLVKHMQFSPNGDFLATCSWDRTAVIWNITGNTVELGQTLYHSLSTGGFVNQVAWSPDGQHLLTRTQKGIKLWDPYTGFVYWTINRERSIQSAAWMPSGNGFLSVECVLQDGTDNVLATNLVRLASDGEEITIHKLDRIQIWDTAIMAGEVRILAVGTLLKTTDHLQPTKSRAEKRLLEHGEPHVPLLQEVRNITLSTQTGNTAYALVSSENKSPPQLWRIDMKTDERAARVIPVQPYLTKTPVDFAGQSYFGGPNDTFVCCSSKNGEIFIWDRESATLLHTLHPGDNEAVKNFGCNYKEAPDFMLVSGDLDGTLRIWSSGAASPVVSPNQQMTPFHKSQSSESPAALPRREASLEIVTESR
ncbi:WD40 repeat-like protein [Ceratobasidium sp. AG-I]|nr:WD40 repeat-like protein [Ceratobasidium sp. AG-I]